MYTTDIHVYFYVQIMIFFLSVIRTDSGVTCLELSIKQHLPKVVTALCERGVDLNVRDQDNDCALWMALETGQEAIASIMVRKLLIS